MVMSSLIRGGEIEKMDISMLIMTLQHVNNVGLAVGFGAGFAAIGLSIIAFAAFAL